MLNNSSYFIDWKYFWWWWTQFLGDNIFFPIDQRVLKLLLGNPYQRNVISISLNLSWTKTIMRIKKYITNFRLANLICQPLFEKIAISWMEIDFFPSRSSYFKKSGRHKRLRKRSIMLYTRTHVDVSRNIITTSMNERTRFFIQIYLSHFILERVDVSCVWKVSWRRRQTATYWPQVSLTIAGLLSHFDGLLNRGSWEPKPSVWRWFSLQHLISNWNCNSNSN